MKLIDYIKAIQSINNDDPMLLYIELHEFNAMIAANPWMARDR